MGEKCGRLLNYCCPFCTAELSTLSIPTLPLLPSPSISPSPSPCSLPIRLFLSPWLSLSLSLTLSLLSSHSLSHFHSRSLSISHPFTLPLSTHRIPTSSPPFCMCARARACMRVCLRVSGCPCCCLCPMQHHHQSPDPSSTVKIARGSIPVPSHRLFLPLLAPRPLGRPVGCLCQRLRVILPAAQRLSL